MSKNINEKYIKEDKKKSDDESVDINSDEEIYDEDEEIEADGFNDGMKKNREIHFFQEEVFSFLNKVVSNSFVADSSSEKVYMNYMREVLLRGIEFCDDKELRAEGFKLSNKLKDSIYEKFKWFTCGDIKYTLQNAESSHFSENDIKAKLNMELKNGSAGILLYNIKNLKNLDIDINIHLVCNYQNKWGIPKGSRESGESFEDCASREFYEECNQLIHPEFLKNCPYIYNRLNNIRYYIVKSKEMFDTLPREPNNEITALGWFNFKNDIIWRNSLEDTEIFMCYLEKYPFGNKKTRKSKKSKTYTESVSHQDLKTVGKKFKKDEELHSVLDYTSSIRDSDKPRDKPRFFNSKSKSKKSWRDLHKATKDYSDDSSIDNKTLKDLKQRRNIAEKSIMSFVLFSEYLCNVHGNINVRKFDYIKKSRENNRSFFSKLRYYSIVYPSK